jgi:hypothetical protein
MQRRRVQFTLRGMMILIAGLAVLLEMVNVLHWRRRRIQELADFHIARSIISIKFDNQRGYYDERIGRERIFTPKPELGARHEELAAKYTRAASYPWLSVEPDPAGYPPEP